MNFDSDDDRASQNTGGNNQFPPPDNIYIPPMLYSELRDDEKHKLLNETGFLYGFFLDSHNGPRRSSRPVARQKKNALQIRDSIQEQNDMNTEVIESESERNANFAHQGWSLSATSTSTPWIASRIAKHNRAPGEVPWVTKRVVVQRLAFTLALQDLEAAPEFKADVRAALDKPSKPEKFEALDEVFRMWGDVVPLAFDLGTSLSISDTKADFNQSLRSTTPIQLDHLTMFKTARINTQGGEANLLPSGDAKAWLSRTVLPQQWSQVRVVRVAPVTDLLDSGIKRQISRLYSTLLSYCPINLRNPMEGGQYFGGGTHGLKTISSLDIRSGTYIHALRANYLDATHSDGWGDKGGEKHVFKLNSDEHITEVVVWSDAIWVYALQFITSDGRISPHYGGIGGTPAIMNAEDGVLVAFSGCRKSNTVSELQTVWRHDVLKAGPSQNDKYSKYFGGIAGTPFNDQGFLNASETASISCIKIRSGTYIDAIQITYQDNVGRTTSETTPWRGGSGGQEKSFQLRSGEHIIEVEGKHNDYIVQLCFKTNQGRSKTFGGGEGTSFSCEPLQKRLSYIAGKRGKWVNGLLFVWAPLTG